MGTPRAAIELDIADFDPMRIQPVRHTLVGHPLLQLEALVEFAQRMAPIGAVRYHSGAVRPDTSFIDAPKNHRIDRPPPEVVREIETANAWLSLHNIQIDPVYRGLVDELLDSVRPLVERKDPDMHFRAGWIFVSSPGAVTPYHFDHEHNFILQVRGEKWVHVFDPLDREIVTDEALDLFHGTGSRDLLRYEDRFQARAHSFWATPGAGAYMPTTAPHWVQNGPEPSITVSVTYFSRETRRRRAFHQLNHALKARGRTPARIGQNPLLDGLKARAFGTYLRGRHAIDRVRKRPFHNLDVTYATNPPGSEYGTE